MQFNGVVTSGLYLYYMAKNLECFLVEGASENDLDCGIRSQ